MEPETSEGSSTLPFDFELPVWDHGTLSMPFDLPRISTDGSAFAANFNYNGHAHDDQSHISGSTSAPLTTASFDMLSSMSDSSAGGHSLPFSPLSATSSSHPAHAMLGGQLQAHAHGHSATQGHGHDSSHGPKSATSAPGSIQSKYLALPLATAHAHRPGHARRQSHSHVQSQHESVGRHAHIPQLTRTVSLGRGTASMAGLAGQGVENIFAAWPTGDTATANRHGHDGLQMDGLSVPHFAALHHGSYNPSPPIPDIQQQQHHYAHHLYQPSPSSGHSTYSNHAFEHNAFDAAAAAALGMGVAGIDGQITPDHQYSMDVGMDMDLDAEGGANTDTENFHHIPYSTINPRAAHLDSHSHCDGEHANASFATDLDLDPSHAPRKPPRGPNLKRGKACGFCRQRKLRCSGDVPRCTMCTKYKRDKCEYVGPMGAGVEAGHSRAVSGSSAGLSEVESRAGVGEGRIGATASGERARASVDLGRRSPGTGSETGCTATYSDLDFAYPYISPPLHLNSAAPAATSALIAASFANMQSASTQVDVPHVHVGFEEAFAAQGPPHETHGFTTTLAPSAQLDHGTPAAQQLLNTPHDLPRETSNQQQYQYTPPQPHLSPTPFYARKHFHQHRHSFPSSTTSPFVDAFNAQPATPALQIPLQPHSGPSTGTSSISNPASYAHRHRLDSTEPPPPGSQVVSDPSGTLYECPPPPSDVLFSSRAVYTDPVVPLTERLGEFLFFPVPNMANGVGAVRGKGGEIKQGDTVASRETESATSDELNDAEAGQGAEVVQRRQSDVKSRGVASHGRTIPRGQYGRDEGVESGDDASLDAQDSPASGHSDSIGGGPIGTENRIVGKIQPDDGLTNAERDAVFDIFFPYSRLFFHMSVPRFKYRLQFKDERRPSPAFLYAIYLWATRFAGQDQLELEEKYFEAGRAAMFDQSTLPYRMLDQMRAGFLLSAYVYGGGRFHEGWVLHGIATRLATSTGLHHITSSTFMESPLSETPFSTGSDPSAATSVSASASASASPRKEAPTTQDPFMRQKKYLLPPPEDRLELAERIHTFWAVFSLDRLATCLTGFPTTIPDDAITTPLPKDFDEIATGRVSARDDYTISDMYADTKLPPERQTQYCHWLKIGTLLERVSKLAFLPPESDSLYAQYKSGATPYFPDLEQARYKRPQEYTMLLAAITRLTASMGADGVLPTLRLAGDSAAVVPNLVIIIHHVRWATLTLLHDVDHADSTNQDALLYARQSVVMIRKMPQMPIHDIDSFAIQVWGVTARVFIKEIRRLTRLNQADAAQKVIEEVGVLLHEINRVGVTMVVARATAQMIQEALHIAQTG